MALHEGGDYTDMIGASEPEIAPTVPTENAKESWVHRHPYTAATIALCALIVLGGSIVLQRMGVTPVPHSGSWGGAGGAFFSTVRNATPIRPNTDTTPSAPTEDYAVIPIFDTSSPEGEPQVPEGLIELLALLVRPTNETSTESVETPGAYSFIPQGLVSTEQPVKTRTKEQDTLHSFGNAVGTLVKPFEESAKINAQSLKDHAEDRGDPGKIAQVEALAFTLAQLGVDILAITDVPESVRAAHKEYGTAYRLLGTHLNALAKAQTDEEFLDAIVAYNTGAENLTKKFLMLVAIFNTNDVTFSSSDPGSIFMFSSSGSL